MSGVVKIFEVGPRDGLQNEKQILPLAERIWLLNELINAGLQSIEAGSMVRADKVPQMAESDQIKPHPSFWYLVPNLKGLERAMAVGVKNIAVFTAVSESFNQKNIGMSIDESFTQIAEILKEAHSQKLQVRAYVSTVWGCPFEGRISAQKAIAVIDRLLALQIQEVSIGDTIGVASPKGVKEVLQPLLSSFSFTPPPLAAHFHDTRGTALANAFFAYELGIRTFDSSIGGLGGCPFAPGAAGNLATEDLVYAFKEMGLITGVNYEKLCKTSLSLFQKMNKPIRSKALQAYQFNCNEKNPWDS